jgi:hypothetical protein
MSSITLISGSAGFVLPDIVISPQLWLTALRVSGNLRLLALRE